MYYSSLAITVLKIEKKGYMLVECSLTKINPNCSPMDRPIIDLQLGLMETV